MREFAFFMAAGVLIETFVVRPLVVPALLSVFGRTSAWPGEIRRVEVEEAPRSG
jgi:RND superfamily putative drug exporter